MPRAPRALPPLPPDCPPELVACFVWTGITHKNEGRYGWMWDPAIRRMDSVHRIVRRRVFGSIPKGPNGRTLEVDELCDISLCVRPDHLDLKTRRPLNVPRRVRPEWLRELAQASRR